MNDARITIIAKGRWLLHKWRCQIDNKQKRRLNLDILLDWLKEILKISQRFGKTEKRKSRKTRKRGKLKWAWEAISGTCMCPYPSRSVRMDLGTTHGLSVSSEESFGNVKFPTEIQGSRRKWSLGFRNKLTGPDWGRGLRGKRYGSGGRSYGSVRTHRDTYGPPMGFSGGPWGPFPIFPNFRV